MNNIQFIDLNCRQYRHKNVSEISADKQSIVYRGIQTFFFDAKASAPLTEDDDLVILNIQMNVSKSNNNNNHHETCGSV